MSTILKHYLDGGALVELTQEELERLEKRLKDIYSPGAYDAADAAGAPDLTISAGAARSLAHCCKAVGLSRDSDGSFPAIVDLYGKILELKEGKQVPVARPAVAPKAPEEIEIDGALFDANGVSQLRNLAKAAGVDLNDPHYRVGYALLRIRYKVEELKGRTVVPAANEGPNRGLPGWNQIPGGSSAFALENGPYYCISHTCAENVKAILNVLDVDSRQHGPEATREALVKAVALVAANGGPDVEG